MEYTQDVFNIHRITGSNLITATHLWLVKIKGAMGISLRHREDGTRPHEKDFGRVQHSCPQDHHWPLITRPFRTSSPGGSGHVPGASVQAHGPHQASPEVSKDRGSQGSHTFKSMTQASPRRRATSQVLQWLRGPQLEAAQAQLIHLPGDP